MLKMLGVEYVSYHPYKRVASAFNGKPKRTQKPEIMTLIDWIREYDIEKGKE
jgi:hypothetical protein